MAVSFSQSDGEEWKLLYLIMIDSWDWNGSYGVQRITCHYRILWERISEYFQSWVMDNEWTRTVIHIYAETSLNLLGIWNDKEIMVLNRNGSWISFVYYGGGRNKNIPTVWLFFLPAAPISLLGSIFWKLLSMFMRRDRMQPLPVLIMWRRRLWATISLIYLVVSY